MAMIEELLQAIDDVVSDGVRRGMMHNVATDATLDGRLLTIHGRRLVNFGSCSYLGLEMHPALRAGVVEAVGRYGTQFSSSRAYVSSPDYALAEALLTELFGRPALISSSTTLGHLAAMPTLVGSQDALLLDHQVHHSVQSAARFVGTQGSTVELVPHSDLEVLERRITELARSHSRVWYACDGLYSMYADFLPAAELDALIARHEQLWLYVDDAHGVSWTGEHGRGYALQHLGPAARARAVVAGSLNKSFAAAGGVLTFPDPEMRRRTFTLGGPMLFSGPVQPPMLGAIVASARLHLSPELVPRQAALLDRIRLFNQLASDRGLPLVSPSEAPIRCIGAGVPAITYNALSRLRDAGCFVDAAIFPAVAPKRSGMRVTLTAHHTEDDIVNVVDAIAEALPAALADEGSSMEILERSFPGQLGGRLVTLPPPVRRQELQLETHSSIETVDRDEWDRLLGQRGAFGWEALRSLQRVFAADSAEVEHAWRFHYWIVRDVAERPIAATFFTTALWKDDMMSSAALSEAVERQRGADPYHLTSTIVGMGSLITEGDHLFLDRTADWRSALRLILQAARAEEDTSGASAVVLRDLPDDPELHAFLVSEGLVRFVVPPTWIRPIDFADDASFLAQLSRKYRYHQRHNVLSREETFRVERATDALTEAERDQLYQLYRNVHARSLRLNVFPLPRRLIDAALRDPCWEVLVLRLVDGPAEPVSFVVQAVGEGLVQPLFVGLDYRYVASHHSYQQTLWQSIRSAQRRGARQVLMGMTADLQKSRFGAVARQGWAYAQASETYNVEVLSRLAQGLSLAG
jgi:7-keto-8-aminopelargonate synthetase-like enzyme